MDKNSAAWSQNQVTRVSSIYRKCHASVDGPCESLASVVAETETTVAMMTATRRLKACILTADK